MLRSTFVALLIGLIALPAAAQIYTWKDANGRVHYSDHPPPNVDAKPTTRSAPKAAPAVEGEKDAAQSAPAAKSWMEKDLEFRQRKAEQAENAAKQQQEEARKQEKVRYCDDVRRNLAMLERGGRVGRANAKGEMELYSDEQMKQEAAKLKAQLNKDCG